MSVAALPYPAVLPHPSAGKSDDFLLRLSVQQYHDMFRQGILAEDDPVELLEGFLVVKMSKNPPLSKSNGRVQARLGAALPTGFFIRAQEPVTLDDGQPEPDVAVVRGDDDRYTDRHPGPAEAPLVVEVADESLARDRTAKLRSYARAGIAVCWIVNLVERPVERLREPGAGHRAGRVRRAAGVHAGPARAGADRRAGGRRSGGGRPAAVRRPPWPTMWPNCRHGPGECDRRPSLPESHRI
jgi:Uma2 family endonuclease